MSKQKHIWTKEETKLALNAYLNKTPRAEAKKLAESLNINSNAFCMRMANFRYLDTDGKAGLSSIKKLELEVWNEYCEAMRSVGAVCGKKMFQKN